MLELRDVRVVYPNGLEALSGASVKASAGEVVIILGRSGAGKSTLLRCINGLQPLTSGSIALDGVDLAHVPSDELADVRRRIGFIWQEHHLVDRLSVFTNVLTGRLGHHRSVASLLGFFGRDDRRIAIRSLERVNLLHRAGDRADRLSGGERQRVGIARALAQQPHVLLADEPVSNLDRDLSGKVLRDLVRVAREEGVPTIICLHDVALAQEFGDRLIGLAHGRTMFDGPPAAVTEAVLDRIYRHDEPRQSLASGERS